MMYNPYAAFYSLQKALTEKQASRTNRPIDAIYKIAQQVNMNPWQAIQNPYQFMKNFQTNSGMASDSTSMTPDSTSMTPDSTSMTPDSSSIWSRLAPDNYYRRVSEAAEDTGIESPYEYGGYASGSGLRGLF